jgi:hypothetical protein
LIPSATSRRQVVVDASGGLEGLAVTGRRAPASASRRPGRRVTTSDDFGRCRVDALSAARTTAQRAGEPAAALRSAAAKLALGLRLLDDPQGSSAVTALAIRLAFEQGQRTDEQLGQARVRIRAHFVQLRQQTEARLLEIRRRIEAQRDRGLWEGFAGLFRVLGHGLSALGAAAGGGTTALIGGGLLALSTICAATCRHPAGSTLALGLAVAGGLLGLGAVAGAAQKTWQQAVKCTAEALQWGSRGAATAGSVGARLAAADQAGAEAALLRLDASIADGLRRARWERQRAEALQQGIHRSLLGLLAIIETEHRASLAAIAAR